jgi:hypothetical protein
VVAESVKEKVEDIKEWVAVLLYAVTNMVAVVVEDITEVGGVVV